MSVVPPTFGKLVRDAEHIVRVEVTAVDSCWDDAPQGKVIHTYVQCRILRTLKGAQQDAITLRLLGGQVGEVGMNIPDMPAFEVGGTYVLFVARNGRAFCPLIGAMYGSYRIVTDKATGADHVARSNGEPLHAAEDVVRPLGQNNPSDGIPNPSGMTRDKFEAAVLEELGHVPPQ